MTRRKRKKEPFFDHRVPIGGDHFEEFQGAESRPKAAAHRRAAPTARRWRGYT